MPASCVRSRDAWHRAAPHGLPGHAAARLLTASDFKQRSHRPLRRRLQKLLQLLLPELRHAGRGVAAGVFAGRDQMELPFFTRFSSRSIRPVSGGLRSSSAALIASNAALIFSSPGAAL